MGATLVAGARGRRRRLFVERAALVQGVEQPSAGAMMSTAAASTTTSATSVACGAAAASIFSEVGSR